MTADVSTPSARYLAGAEKRLLPRTLMGGTKAMQAAGQKFMLKHPAESDAAYDVRLKGTTLYNGFKQAVHAQTGKVFSRPVIIGEDVPPLLAPYLDDMDGQGRELTPFAMDVFMDAMVDGVTFILVDFPVVQREDGSAPTLADQQVAGARPYCVPVLADQLIGWSTSNESGTLQLSQVRIKETCFEQDGEWGEKEVHRIRVLTPGAFAIYEQQVIPGSTSAGKYVLVDQGATSLPFIPLVPIYANRTGFMEGEPPLSALADLNLEHWISSSENRKALTFLRFAMLAITGVAADATVAIGPDKVLKLPAGADAKYLEHTGAGIKAGFDDLAAIEKRMEQASMTVRVENAGKVTATAAAINSEDANAGLKAIADGLGDSLELVLQYMAQMMGIATGGGTLEVNDDFAQAAAMGTPAELLAAYGMGAISLETYLAELQRRHVLDDELNIQDEIERIQGAAQMA
ncbi:MAG: DUF4055 domain-containing protein [Gallionella sp.]|nr:DUF4055 domain-containing protein [Gallionella sp.]